MRALLLEFITVNNEFIFALLSGLGGMLGWGFADFFAKKTVDHVGSIVSLVWAHFFGTCVLIVIALANIILFKGNFVLPNSTSIWGGLLFFGVLQALVYLFAYEGFGKGKLALLNPIFASYSGVAVIISLLIFGEAISISLFLSLMVIFGGVLLTCLDFKSLGLKQFKNFSFPGLKEVLLAAFMAAFWQVFWDRFLGGNSWLSYTLLMYAFMTFTAYGIAILKKVEIKVKKSHLWIYFFLIGFCEVIAYLALSIGFAATSFTSIVIILAGAFSLPTILLARIFLKEKVTTIQTIGSIVIISGIILLSIIK